MPHIVGQFSSRINAIAARQETALAVIPDLRPPQIIYVVNNATVSLGVDFTKLVEALQIYCDRFFTPAWGFSCKLIQASSVPVGKWGLTFLDEDPNVAGALGYHSLENGVPVGRVLVKTIQKYGEQVSVTASHEIIEILGDPGVNLLAFSNSGVIYAIENADATQDTDFPVNGIPMSNFVTPAWFDGFRGPGQKFDHLNLINRPFELLPGGYANVLVNGSWGQIFGSREAEAKFRSRFPGQVYWPGVRILG